MLYESLVRQIASTQITSSQQNLHQAVSQTIQIEAIKREMAAIRKKELKEQQPQKKFALHQKYMQLKKKLVERIYRMRIMSVIISSSAFLVLCQFSPYCRVDNLVSNNEA